MTDREKTRQWIEKLKQECKGLTPKQRSEIESFAKYKAWQAIELKFNDIHAQAE